MTGKKNPNTRLAAAMRFPISISAAPNELLIRAQLSHTVRIILKPKKLKQSEIGKPGIDQGEVSKLMNGSITC
jgi:predicted XRE-type DNA-binding protein